MSAHDVPAHLLSLHNLLDIHCAAQHHHSQYAQSDRQLVADNHRPAAHRPDERILTVTAPSRQQDAQHPDRRSRQHEEDTDIHVQHLAPLVPRQARESKDRSQNYQKRRQPVQKAVGTVGRENLLRQNLHHIRRHLQQSAPSAHAVRPDAALKRRTHLALHIDKHDGQHGIHQQDEHPHGQSLQRERQPLRQERKQPPMHTHEQRLQIIIVCNHIQSSLFS